MLIKIESTSVSCLWLQRSHPNLKPVFAVSQHVWSAGILQERGCLFRHKHSISNQITKRLLVEIRSRSFHSAFMCIFSQLFSFKCSIERFLPCRRRWHLNNAARFDGHITAWEQSDKTQEQRSQKFCLIYHTGCEWNSMYRQKNTSLC